MQKSTLGLAATSLAVAASMIVSTGTSAQAASTSYLCKTYYSGDGIGVPYFGQIEACTVRTGVYYQLRVTYDLGVAFYVLDPTSKLTWWAKRNGGNVAGATGTSWSTTSTGGNSVTGGKWQGRVMWSATYSSSVGAYVQFLGRVNTAPNVVGPPNPGNQVYPLFSPTVKLSAT